MNMTTRFLTFAFLFSAVCVQAQSGTDTTKTKKYQAKPPNKFGQTSNQAQPSLYFLVNRRIF
jgi:hypothetical protein